MSDALHDRPTAAELVEAVREFLERDVLSNVTGRLQFHARVAVNALGIVQRELENPSLIEAHQLRLHDLGFEDDAALAAAIRTGALDDRFEEVLRVVRASVADKLAVSNPTYG